MSTTNTPTLTDQIELILNDEAGQPHPEHYPLVHAANGPARIVFDPDNADHAWIQSNCHVKRSENV